MKSKKIVSFLVVISCLFPGILWADFTEGNLFVVNQPSSGSAGYDFILEFSPQGSNLGTLIPQSLHILGMRDLAFDPVSGHLFYTVSSWTEQIFEIREIDENGILVHTYTHSDFGSGNIELVFDRAGNLFVANCGHGFGCRSYTDLQITMMGVWNFTQSNQNDPQTSCVRLGPGLSDRRL